MSQVHSLIPDHLDHTTQMRWLSIIKTYGITDSTTWADVGNSVTRIPNINTKRTVILTLRQIMGREGSPKVPATVRRTYNLPTEAEIVQRSQGKYQVQVLCMAFAGLRIGEACALRPEHAETNGVTCWIDVVNTRDFTGTVKKPKTGGRVIIPKWLFDLIKTMEPCEILPNSLYKYLKRRDLQPHGLRHWYATYLVRTTNNPEIARRQLRHSNLTTTLQTYVEIKAQDELASIAGFANPFGSNHGQ